jgi:hypothetical protein
MKEFFIFLRDGGLFPLTINCLEAGGKFRRELKGYTKGYMELGKIMEKPDLKEIGHRNTLP